MGELETTKASIYKNTNDEFIAPQEKLLLKIIELLERIANK